MTTPEDDLFLELCDGVWEAFCDRGVEPGGAQELHVSWRCPSVAAAEALEAALGAAGTAVGVAQPNAEAGGRGFGVAATVPVRARREDLEDMVARMIRVGAQHGAMVVGVGTMFHD
jgi:hypothetical protein